MDSQPLERCDNCLKDFPESKMATHYGYCRRNIKKCPICQEMFDINFKEEHDEEYHRKEKCPHCTKEFPSSDFKEHEKKCDLKPKFCEYCELNVPVSGFSTHFKACESRTKPCSKCNKPIMNKDYLIHFVSCDGIVEQPRQPANYQEHMLQQQKKREEQYVQNQIDRVASRDKPASQVVKPKEERVYAGIVNTRNTGQQRVVYEPRIINPPRPELEKKESSNKYIPAKQEYKQEISNPVKRMAGNMLPPPSVVQVKREEPRTSGLRPPIAANNYQQKRTNASREGTRPQPASRDAVQPHQYQANKYSVKDSKSIERTGPSKREEQMKNKYGNQNINPKVEDPRRPVINKPQPFIPKEEIVRKKSPEPKIETHTHQFSMADLGLSPEQQMLQEILMQSANDHKPKTRIAQPVKPGQRNNEIPYIQGQDIMSESFIEKQKAIEQQFTRQRKGRRP